MTIHDAELLDDDGASSLDRAQKAAEEAPPMAQAEEQERCCFCKREIPMGKTYRTGAGTVCFDCAAEFEDPGLSR